MSDARGPVGSFGHEIPFNLLRHERHKSDLPRRAGLHHEVVRFQEQDKRMRHAPRFIER